jgi:hypothetical protein
VISPVARPQPSQDNTNTEEKRTFMPRVGFEPKIRMFKRAKISRILDSAAAVIGIFKIVHLYYNKIHRFCNNPNAGFKKVSDPMKINEN